MGKEGIDLSFADPGSDIESLRQAIIELRAEVNRRDFAFMRILSLQASNISISAGGPETPIGNIGRDPQSQNIWGFIAERGYGFHVRYQKANYGRMFVDSGNDSGHSTPSMIIDMPSPDKLVFKDDGSHTIMRLYGRTGQEVGFAANWFTGYGAVDLFAPMRYFTFDYNGGTAGGPETYPGYLQDGFAYIRQNYGSTRITDMRIFVDGLWRSVSLNQEGTKYSRALASEPVAEHIAVREVVTVTIS